MAFSSTHPIEAYSPRPSVPTEGFRTTLANALDAYYPTDRNNLPHYDSVSVLLLLWEDDHHDLKCGYEVERLETVFARSYGYSTKILKIPIIDPNKWLFETFADFASGKTARDLLIVYYAGHATMSKGTPILSPCIWGSVSQLNSNFLHPPGTPEDQIEVHQKWFDFTGPRALLCAQPSDVLFLLDCCHAAGTAIGGNKELIAACRVEAVARIPGYESFTTALVQELEHASEVGEYLTVAMLYRKLLQKTFQGSLGTSPIHAELSGRSSILLLPQERSNRTPTTPATPAIWPSDIPVAVVLTVSLRDGSPNTLNELRSWLTQSKHSCAEKVKLRTLWKGIGSYTMVFELPIEVWYCLVPHVAIKFLDFRFDAPEAVES